MYRDVTLTFTMKVSEENGVWEKNRGFERNLDKHIFEVKTSLAGFGRGKIHELASS